MPSHNKGFERYWGTMLFFWLFSTTFCPSRGFSGVSSCSASHFSASSAAMQPEPIITVSNSLQSFRVQLQRTCTSHSLPISLVLDVTSCKDAVHTGQSTSGRCDKIAILVHFQLPLK